MGIEQKIKECLQKLNHRGVNLVDGNVIQALQLQKDSLFVTAKLDGAGTEEKNQLAVQISTALEKLTEIKEARVRFADAEQPPSTAANAAPSSPKRKTYLQNYKEVIAVASGKGGVGKSTLALNLALALKKQGKTVSLLDADIYGPSLPMMLGMRGSRPKAVAQKIFPLQKLGLDFLSIGNLVGEGQSIVWRGPMAHQAIEQLLRDTDWPGGDIMVIDMPPGTGDVQISLSQLTEISGAVIVCTPQEVALLDARRALSMFEKVSVPILGLVENMSSFVCPHCQKATEIFGSGTVQEDSKRFGVPFLGAVPIELGVREASDAGKPVVEHQAESLASVQIINIAKNLIQILEEE